MTSGTPVNPRCRSVDQPTRFALPSRARGEAWGGPPAYSERHGGESFVVRMHAGNGVHADMDRRAIACFGEAMDRIGLTDPELRRVLHDYFAWATTSTMAAYPDDPDDVPADLRVPRWSWDGLQR